MTMTNAASHPVDTTAASASRALDSDQSIATDRGQLSSAAKAMMLLDVFHGGPPSLGVTEIARDAGLPKSTAFRLLNVLTDHGFVARNGSRYCLGFRMFELGSHTAYSRPRSIRAVATPVLCDLYAKFRSTVHLGVLDGDEVLYLEKLHGPDQMNTPSHVGSRLPASLTAVGKVLLAFANPDDITKLLESELPRRTQYSITDRTVLADGLAAIRRDGYGVDHEESTLGIVCYAAPIRVGQRVVAAVSLCTPASASMSSGQRMSNAVRHAADEIGRALPRSLERLTAAA
jgi:DNA-binding IclR family transcriptional regulator